MTVNVHVSVRPPPSVAVAVTVVTPVLNVADIRAPVVNCILPLWYATVGVPQLSVAVAGLNVTIEDEVPHATVEVAGCGQTIAGGWLSTVDFRSEMYLKVKKVNG